MANITLSRSLNIALISSLGLLASAWAWAGNIENTTYTPTWVWVCLVSFAGLICSGILWELYQKQRLRTLKLQHGLTQEDTLNRITQQMSALQNSNTTAAAKAQELNQRLRMVFDLADDGMFLLKVELSDSFRILAANKAYLRLLGKEKKQVVGHRIDELRASSQDKLSLIKHYKQATQEGEPVCFIETLETDHGVVYLETTLTPIFDELRYCTHVQGVSRLQQSNHSPLNPLQINQFDITTGLPKHNALFAYSQSLLNPRTIQKNPFALIYLQANDYAQWL